MAEQPSGKGPGRVNGSRRGCGPIESIGKCGGKDHFLGVWAATFSASRPAPKREPWQDLGGSKASYSDGILYYY